MERLKERWITEFLIGEHIKKTAELSQELYEQYPTILPAILFNMLLQAKWLEYQLRN